VELAGKVYLITAMRGYAGAIAYGVARDAIPQFTRALARELADLNIRVNCVPPGIIRPPEKAACGQHCRPPGKRRQTCSAGLS
jgi:NAD(P)-dependent dehydrogenase (short-subunit alcohol dehydrogenase family)